MFILFSYTIIKIDLLFVSKRNSIQNQYNNKSIQYKIMNSRNQKLVCCWVIKCTLCGRKGHWSHDCPSKK